MPEQNIERAFSSKLSLVERHGKKFVRKEVDAEEAANELFFFRTLKERGLPWLEAEKNADGLFLEYVESTTLDDHETPDAYRKWGAIVRRMHNITFDHPFAINENGERRDIEWKTFIERQMHDGLNRQKTRNGFSDVLSLRIVEEIRRRGVLEMRGSASLLHCDLHQNNVLISEDDRFFLIDKGPAIAAGESLYDLGLIGINLPGAFGYGDPKDADLLRAFINGYGIDFTADTKRYEGYLLLRCLERWSDANVYEQAIPQIVEGILEGEES